MENPTSNSIVIETVSRGVIHPENTLKLIWEILGMLLIIYQAIFTPLVICFNMKLSPALSALEISITLIFILDIFVSFNSGFYQKGSLIMNRKAIAKKYLSLWFWFDLLASFPYSWVTGGISLESDEDDQEGLGQAPQLLRLVKIFRFMRILKLLRLAKLKNTLIKLEDYISSSAMAVCFILLKMLTGLFFIGHWIACWWYFIGDSQSQSHPVTWVVNAGLQDKPLSEQYVTALYWAFTTMTTVGYGDIYAFTASERIYSMLTMILACGVFAYTIGNIGALFTKSTSNQTDYRDIVVAINKYMKKKRLNKGLKFRVKKYLDYVWDKESYMDEKQMLGMLSEPLRDVMFDFTHRDVIRKCLVFHYFEMDFVSSLCRCLEDEFYAPGDTVFREGEVSESMYFIKVGNVEVFHPGTETCYTTLGPDDFFGEIAFFTGRPRSASVRCLYFSDLLKLSRIKMNRELEKFPDANDIANFIRKSCKDGDFSFIFEKCFICNQIGHVAIQCETVLLNCNQNGIRDYWLSKRSGLRSNLIVCEDLPNTRTEFRTPFTARNVNGIERQNNFDFPESLRNAISQFNTDYPQKKPTQVDVISDIESESIDYIKKNEFKYCSTYETHPLQSMHFYESRRHSAAMLAHHKQFVQRYCNWYK